MPASPVGASATGIATGWPSMVDAMERRSTFIATRWRNFSSCRSAWLDR
jgi:hypothetical protein